MQEALLVTSVADHVCPVEVNSSILQLHGA